MNNSIIVQKFIENFDCSAFENSNNVPEPKI
jgi:hypothetical protein